MNVYDFDNTILRGDSTARFFAFCLLRAPRIWRRAPTQIANALLFAAKLRPKQRFKQCLLSFFADIGDMDAMLERFWDANEGRVKRFYLDAQRPDDVVISASPQFLLEPICARLGIEHLLGSPVNPRTGQFSGLNCHGEEKVRRFYEAFPDGQIDDFFSDSNSDAPLARIAKRAYMVKGNRVSEWNINGR